MQMYKFIMKGLSKQLVLLKVQIEATTVFSSVD